MGEEQLQRAWFVHLAQNPVPVEERTSDQSS